MIKHMLSLLLVLIFTLSFAACGAQEIPPVSPEEEKEPTLAHCLQEKAEQYNTFESIAATKEESELLSQLGITAGPIALTVTEDLQCLFTLTLTTPGGGQYSVDITCPCRYTYPTGTSDSYSLIRLAKLERPKWGCIGNPREGVLSLCTQSGITLLDIAAMQPLSGFSASSDTLPGQEWNPVGIAWQEGYGYIVPYTNGTQEQLLHLDESGALLDAPSLPAGALYYTSYDHTPQYCNDLKLEDWEGRCLIGGNTMIPLQGGKALCTYMQYAETQGNWRLYIRSFYDNSRSYPYGVALYDGNTLHGLFRFADDWNLPAGSAPEPLENTLTVSGQGQQAVLALDYYDMLLHFDFAEGRYEATYDIQPEHLENLLATSADGAYELWSSSIESGGDVWLYNVVLRRTATGQLIGLGRGGGMYGGHFEQGFLQNGDVYLSNLTTLKLYNPTMGECIFDLAQYFSLGLQQDTASHRYLFAFRRDPASHGWILIYTEEPADYWDTPRDYTEPLSYTYRVAVLDSAGQLTDDWDTGQTVEHDPFGYSFVQLGVQDGTLLMLVRGNKSGKYEVSTLDLAAHTCTARSSTTQ